MVYREGIGLVVAVAKPHRITSRAAIAAARKEFSELSGLPACGEPHHIIPRSCGGPDHVWNLVQLTGLEHRGAHDGRIPVARLFAVVARREGVDVETVIQTVNQMRGRG